MLKTWGLSNFKSIQNADLELAPLTILTGTNSSGKSSFIQSILLIAQTMRNNFSERSLVLNGDFVDLGQFEDIRSRPLLNSKGDHLPVGIRWSYKGVGNIEREEYILEDALNELDLEEFNEEYENATEKDKNSYLEDERFEMTYEKDYIIDFTLEFNSLHSKNIFSDEEKKRYKKEQFSPRVVSIQQKIFDLEYDKDEYIRFLNIKEDLNLDYENKIPTYKTDFNPIFSNHGDNDFSCPVEVNHFWPKKIDISTKWKKYLLELYESNKDKITPNIYFEACFNVFGDLFKNFKYLGPLRYRESYYPFSKAADPKDVGVKGEYTAAVLDMFKDKNCTYKSPEFFENNSQGINQTCIKTLREALNEWLNYLGITDNLESEITKDRYLIELNEINISHVGTGVSQVLPILITCLMADKGSTLIFEQPELHLHPKMQSKLSDFFIAIALSGRQIIVETHSEHIINNLCYRYASSENDDDFRDLSKIYFAEKQDGRTSFKPISINKYGTLSDWPEDFFDEAQNANKKIIDEALKKSEKEDEDYD